MRRRRGMCAGRRLAPLRPAARAPPAGDLRAGGLQSTIGGGMLPRALLASLLATLPIAARAQRCTVAGVTGVAFGAYDPIGANAAAPRDATGQIQYQCGATPLVTLSTGASGSYQPRQLRQGAQALAYNLYRDAARTQIWGDGTAGTATVMGQRGKRTLVIYGRIFPGQPAAAGSYGDTLVATLNF